MKKIAIVTICDSDFNYGNRLQNYAVEQVYRKMGLECKTIKTNQRYNKHIIRVKAALNKMTGYRLSKLQTKYRRILMAENFNKKYIHMSKSYLNNTLKSNDFDFFSIGSDQVWNTAWYSNGIEKIYMLEMAEDNQKICFSPSFGTGDVPEEWKEYFKEKLSKFKNISVREESGKRIVKELTGKNAEVLIDPTLMLGKEEWNKLAKKPSFKTEKHYLFAYFLGNMTDDDQAYIDNISRENKLQIIMLKNDSEYWGITKAENFLWLIDNADIVCTDSFHGAVFSVIMNTPFVAFDRRYEGMDMNSRIETLLNMLKMTGRRKNNVTAETLFTGTNEEVPEILERERRKVISFLEKSMREA